MHHRELTTQVSFLVLKYISYIQSQMSEYSSMCYIITLGSVQLDYKYGENKETHPYMERPRIYTTFTCLSYKQLFEDSVFLTRHKANQGFPGGPSGKEPKYHCRRHKRWGFDPWVRKIPWRRAWQPSPVFLPGEYNRQWSLVGYSLQVVELAMTEVTQHTCTAKQNKLKKNEKLSYKDVWEY